MKKTITLVPGELSLGHIRQINDGPVTLELAKGCLSQIESSCNTVNDVIRQGRVIYGINTGFGLLANTVIPTDELEQLQHSIVLSHAAGIGDLMKESTVRLIMALKIFI